MSSDFQTFEHAQTKQEYDENQLRLEIDLSGVLSAFSEEEKEAWLEELNSLNHEAITKTITELIQRHPIEFEQILLAYRKKFGIVDDFYSPLFQQLAQLEAVSEVDT